ncbi:MAG: ATP-grasp domain-containing protein [Firmicutes bacterium]|nr:ATP-grasp domain-containing protein [Bacillota bacterium]
MKNEYVIIIGRQENSDSEIRAIKKLGYKIALFKPTIDFETCIEVDYPVMIDLDNETEVVEKVEEFSLKNKIAGIYTLSEYRVTLAARIAERLNLTEHSLSYLGAINCFNKKRTREILNNNGISFVKYQIVSDLRSAREAIHQIAFPIVVKPLNDAGSNLVSICKNNSELETAIENIIKAKYNSLGQMLESEILIEEYLEGEEYSIEACTINNLTSIISITKKYLLSADIPVEIGHSVPTKFNDQDFETLYNMISQAFKVLDIKNAVTHTEIKMTSNGPKIIEINARPGGDEIPYLVNAITGINLHELALEILLGGDLNSYQKNPIVAKSASIRYFSTLKPGIFDIKREMLINLYPEIVTIGKMPEYGTMVTPTNNNYSRLGYFIVFGDTESYAEKRANEILKNVKVIRD